MIEINMKDIDKSFTDRMKQKKANWKACLEGKQPLLIAKSDRFRLNFVCLPQSEVHFYQKDNYYLFNSIGYRRENVSSDVSGLLARELDEIKRERLRLMKKEQRVLKKYFERGRALKINFVKEENEKI